MRFWPADHIERWSIKRLIPFARKARTHSEAHRQSANGVGHGHGTQKPVECMRRPIEYNSSPGQAIYDPFSGSGTTIIAAEMAGRSCFAIDVDPAYVDVAVLRWRALTGGTATLAEDGRSLADVALERITGAATAPGSAS
jgi:DNA modification methylase